MGIRIRNVGGTLVALCAARSVPKDGDVYLDDAVHAALVEKFAADFASEGFYRGPLDERVQKLIDVEESDNEGRSDWDRRFA